MPSSTKETEAELLLRFGARHRTCRVLVHRDAHLELARRWRWSRAAVIGDATVLALHGDALHRLLSPITTVTLLPFPPGEAHKTRATKQQLEDSLLQQGFDRHGCIVALGGGISLDLAGFVAATYMRGVAHVNLPTSLLAQVDAAIGGKTGLNTPRGKNLVGAVHQPELVLVDPAYLDTLPAAQWACGVAELVKHAVIADEPLLGWIEEHRDRLDGPPWRLEPYPLLRCAQIKGAIVEQDELESGARRQLNYGHTVAHGLEMATGHALDHGRAVALGMLVEGRVAASILGFDQLQRLRRCLDGLNLPTRLPDLELDALQPYLALDKKNQHGALRMALPRRIGAMADPDGSHTVEVPYPLLRQAWDEERACSA